MYRLTTVAVLFAAIMHAVVFFLGNFSSTVLPILIFTALYLYFAVFLYQQKRWAAWAAFIAGVAGVVAIFLGANDLSGVADTALHATAMINAIVAGCAAITLWTTKSAPSSSTTTH